MAAEDEALEREEEDPLAQVERDIQGKEPAAPRAPEDTSDPALFTPQGKRRSTVTESEGLSYSLPDPKLLRRSTKGQGPDTSNQDEISRHAGGDAGPLRHRGQDGRTGQRPPGDAPRAAARARHQGLEGHPAEGRHRLRARLHRHPHPRPDPRQAGGRRGGAQQAPPDGLPRRHLPPRPGREGGQGRRQLAAVGVARQGHRRQLGLDGPRSDAPPAGRGHDRLRKVRLHQHDAVVDPDALHAERGADGARRPEAGRAQPLRGHPASAHAGRECAAHGRERAREPDPRDGDRATR